MKSLATLALVMLAMSFTSSARAGILGYGIFGFDEEVVQIGKMEGTGMRIGYKTTAYYFFAGMYLSNDGYVLIKGKDVASCTPLDDEKIRGMQKSGRLPTPMPRYSISLGRYLWGFSLWVAVIVVAIVQFGVRRLIDKKL